MIHTSHRKSTFRTFVAWLVCVKHPDPDVRRRGGNVIVMALSLIAISFFFLPEILDESKDPFLALVQFFGSIIPLGLGAVAARRGLVAPAAVAMIVTIVLSILGNISLAQEVDLSVTLLCLSILVTGITLRSSAVVAVTIICSGALALMTLLWPNIPLEDIQSIDVLRVSAVVCFTCGALSFIGARSVEHALRTARQAQARAEATLAELDRASRLLEQRVETRTAELGRSQALLRGLIDHSPTYIFVKDLSGRVLLVNRRSAAAMNRDMGEILGRTYADVLPAELAHAWGENDQQVIATRQPHFYEDILPVNGDMRAFNTTLFPIYDEQDQFVAIGGIATDVTEHRWAEEANRSLVEHSLQGLAIYQDERIIFANPMLSRITGYSLDELYAMSLQQLENLVFEEDKQLVVSRRRDQRLGKQPPPNWQLRVIHKDGTLRWLENYTVVVQYRGRPAIQVTYVDITERKQVEDALEKSEERYRSVVAAMTEGITLQDTDSTILACNTSAERILGLTTDQMMGRTSLDPRWHSIREDGSPFPGETHPSLATLRTGQPCNDVIMGVHKPDGTLTWISINTQPLLRPGETKPYAVVCSFSDITRRREAEQGLRQSTERLKSLYNIAQAILASQSSAAIAQAALSHLHQLVPCSTSNVGLFDFAAQQLRLVAFGMAGTVTAADGVSLPILHPPEVIESLQRGAPYLVEDLLALDLPEDFRPAVQSLSAHSFLAVPLCVQDKLIGVLNISVDRPEGLADQHFTIALEVAALLSIAINQSQLYEQAHLDAETKATLLREANHRVKNNLAAIIGLLYAEKRRAPEGQQTIYQAIIEQLIGRVQSLAAVHSVLTATAWQPVRLSALIRRLVQLVVDSLPSTRRVLIDVQESPVLMMSDQSHSLALIVNELTINAVKYAWPDTNQPLQISVRIDGPDERLRLEFRDNGPGYLDAVIQRDHVVAQVGLDVIRDIVRKGLRGEMELSNDGGAVTVIRFPLQVSHGNSSTPAGTPTAFGMLPSNGVDERRG